MESSHNTTALVSQVHASYLSEQPEHSLSIAKLVSPEPSRVIAIHLDHPLVVRPIEVLQQLTRLREHRVVALLVPDI